MARTEECYRALSILGLPAYYQRFIRNYAEKAALFSKLTSKHKRFAWSAAHAEAFQVLKDEMCSPPVLRYPVFHTDMPFSLKTDGIDVAAGAVLCQRQEGEGEHAVAYANRKFNSSEQNYPTFQQELLAVV